MRIRPLSDTQKIELLLSIVAEKPMDFSSPLGHLVVDYLPVWDTFSQEVRSNVASQKKMGGSWSCFDCNELQDIISQIDAITHRSVDYDDPNEEDFTCNCSYCQIVTGYDCQCGRCGLSNNDKHLIYKDYVTGNEVTVKV